MGASLVAGNERIDREPLVYEYVSSRQDHWRRHVPKIVTLVERVSASPSGQAVRGPIGIETWAETSRSDPKELEAMF